ncbi:MAG: aminopeptidase [Lachnospiraceae bacterium]|nr:aminopeptidase [Lachnospiraceae bacterium]
MDYRRLYENENREIDERFNLVMDRIMPIPYEHAVAEPFGSFFDTTAAFISDIQRLYNIVNTKSIMTYNMEQLKEQNAMFFDGFKPGTYETSYADPDRAVELLGEEYGAILSFLYVKMRDMIPFAFMQRKLFITLYCELFIEIYHIFEDKELTSYEAVKNAIYWFEKDNSDIFLENSIREANNPELSFATNIIMESNLTDLRYLYMYGEYVGPNELGTAAFLNTLLQEEIDTLAKVYTEGFRLGFANAKKDIKKKKNVQIHYNIGFERIVKAAIKNFEEMGLRPVIFRGSYQSTKFNAQYLYDHKYDNALFMDKGYVNRRIEVTRDTYETIKDLAGVMAGPAVIEIFGEDPFEPVRKKNAFKLSESQEKLQVEFSRERIEIIQKYRKSEETSFTIIAFPVPEIGSNYQEIFVDTAKINSLDQRIYGGIQQKLIATLDKAEYVRVVGKGDNKTYINVNMHEMKHPEDETNFENCLADVNIPLGEVFTTPKLEGTDGVLNVSSVYLNGLNFKNLSITFENGQIKDYTCDNFDDEEDNKKYIKENVLFNHDTLPIGEFAIGTNTAAYMMANKYDIVYKLPILIVEKMGPHFAVGDTCYSWEEDYKTYNPDGKEIVAKDNEITINRKEDVSKAYFNCHTDITIPYEEIGEIVAVTKEGWELDIIRDGRFVLRGTEKLNEAFDEH